MQSLRFLHIPKSAGTTFTQILNKQYRNELKYQFTGDIKSDTERFNSLLKKDQRNTVLFTGHAPIFTGIDCIDSIDVITFLRDPVSRVKSFCQHVSEGKSPYLTKRFPSDNFDLDSFLNSGVHELNNLQTKMLLNTGASAVNFKIPTSDAVKTAFNNLTNKIIAYGLVEYFDESLILFQEKFEWELPVYFLINQKDSNKLIEFSPHQIEKIKQLNALDIELYYQARVKFLSCIENKSFNKVKLKKLRKMNKYRELCHTSLSRRFMTLFRRIIKR